MMTSIQQFYQDCLLKFALMGGCTPIGMKKQYPSFIHISAKDYDKIIISGGRLGTQIIINSDDLVKVICGKYADIIIH